MEESSTGPTVPRNSVLLPSGSGRRIGLLAGGTVDRARDRRSKAEVIRKTGKEARMAPNKTRVRAVLQSMEIVEFAQRLGFAVKHKGDVPNTVIWKWIEEGHAKKFYHSFTENEARIRKRCRRKCGRSCCGDFTNCPLKNELHRLLRDEDDWKKEGEKD
jgi:hypothetical protein